MKLFNSVNDFVGLFLGRHPTVKSAWRMAIFVLLAAMADEYGVSGILRSVLEQAQP